MLKALVTVLVMAGAVSAQANQTRCGWIENPTPANIWLTDKDATWIIEAQGGASPGNYEAFDPIWNGEAETINVNKSRLCGCITGVFAHSTEGNTPIVAYIESVKSLSLKTCRQDKNIKPVYPN